MKVKINKKKLKLPFMILILIIEIVCYTRIFLIYNANKKFDIQVETIAKNNEKTVFSLEKIMLVSSANIINNSSNNKSQNLDIFQYTDIAVYINNGDELTNENTVKSMYIDKIELTPKVDKGEQSLNYKNYQTFGTIKNIKFEKNENINFNVVYTNEENKKANYDEPTFYTDCSNPITLGYVNKDILKGFSLNENSAVNFDGRILESAGIKVEDINCNIKFRVNIVSNENKKYTCYLSFNLPLNDIYSGTSMKSTNLKGVKYKFFCNQ